VQCPSCFAEIPDDSYECPQCGVRVDGSRYGAAPLAPEPEPEYGAGVAGGYGAPGLVEDTTPLELGDSLFRPFKDPEAVKKFLMMGLFNCIPIVGPIVLMGYYVDYTRRIIYRKNSWTLPTWDDFGGLLTGGVFLFLAVLIYFFAMMAIGVIAFIPFIGAATMLKEKIQQGGDAAAGIIISTFAIPFMILGLLVIILSLIQPMIQVFYSRNKEFGDAFKIGQMFKIIMADLGSYIIIMLSIFGISFLAMIPLMMVSAMLGFIPFLGQLVAYYIGSVVGVMLGLISISAFAEYYYKNAGRLME